MGPKIAQHFMLSQNTKQVEFVGLEMQVPPWLSREG
jgi:hypothetical protein